MVVSPCTALRSSYAHTSTSGASTWSLRRATGAQRLSSERYLVRVLEPLVKDSVSQGKKHTAFERLTSSCEIQRVSTPYRWGVSFGGGRRVCAMIPRFPRGREQRPRW